MAGYRLHSCFYMPDDEFAEMSYASRTTFPLPGPIDRDAATAPVVKTSEPPKPGTGRLQQITKLVEDNNKSTLETEIIVAQIYMESRFDAKAGQTHDAKGLMQMQLNAVKQVYKYRKQKERGGKMPSDAQTQAAFAEAATFHASQDIFDEATNIQLGTEYMQYWLDTTPTIEDAYKKYRGKSDGVYYRKISACAKRLKAEPGSMQPLLDMVAVPKKK